MMMMMMMMMIQTMERQKDFRIKLLSSFSSNTIFSFAGGNTAAPWLPIAPFQPRLKGKAGWDPTLTAHFSSKVPLAFEKWCPLVIDSFSIHHGDFWGSFSYIFLFRFLQSPYSSPSSGNPRTPFRIWDVWHLPGVLNEL